MNKCSILWEKRDMNCYKHIMKDKEESNNLGFMALMFHYILSLQQVLNSLYS